MQNHAKLCFAHKSLVQAWRIIIFGRIFFSEWFASKVKLAKKQQQQQISTYVIWSFHQFLVYFFFFIIYKLWISLPLLGLISDYCLTIISIPLDNLQWFKVQNNEVFKIDYWKHIFHMIGTWIITTSNFRADLPVKKVTTHWFSVLNSNSKFEQYLNAVQEIANKWK